MTETTGPGDAPQTENPSLQRALDHWASGDVTKYESVLDNLREQLDDVLARTRRLVPVSDQDADRWFDLDLLYPGGHSFGSAQSFYDDRPGHLSIGQRFVWAVLAKEHRDIADAMDQFLREFFAARSAVVAERRSDGGES